MHLGGCLQVLVSTRVCNMRRDEMYSASLCCCVAVRVHD
jgi:hypothetical protein